MRSITYVEAFNTLSPSVFPALEACPRDFLLPNLVALTWKAESAAGLACCRPYLAPRLQTFTLEMGVRAPKIHDFLDELMARTQLTAFSFTLHSNLPETFVEKVKGNSRFEKLAIMAPGALAARVGKWASSLPLLKSLALDLSNASTRAVEGFFNDIGPGSGYSTPSSVGHDSGVFSGEDDVDFTEVRKSVLRLTSDGPRHGAFPQLTLLSLTGDAANIATFLRHITSPLTQIELAIEDPPAPDDWADLCALLGNHFGTTLQVLRITATSSSRFAELVRSTSRAGDAQLQRLPLTALGPLPHLHRLDIELPESAVFHNADAAHLARVCPALEVARLCGQARFAPAVGPPPLTLEGLIPLTSGCAKLHTLNVVVHAAAGADATFRVREHSSRALMRLNVGHSWVADPLGAAILLSHVAPHLETLRWFQQAGGRAGATEKHAAAWQQVQDFLPALQNMRLIERSLMPKPVVVAPPRTAHKEVDATVRTVQRGVLARPEYVDEEMQADGPVMVEADVQVAPETVEEEVQAWTEMASVEVDATPTLVDEGVDAIPEVVEQAVDAAPEVEEKGTDPIEPQDTPLMPGDSVAVPHTPAPPLFTSFIPSVNGLVTLPFRAVRVYTYYLSLPLRFMFSSMPSMPTMPALSDYASSMQSEPKSPSSPTSPPQGVAPEQDVNSMNPPSPHAASPSDAHVEVGH